MNKLTTILMALLAMWAGTAQAQPSASCVIRIESDSSTLPLHPDMVNALVQSSGVMEAALGSHVEALRADDMAGTEWIDVKLICMERRSDLLIGQLRVELWDNVYGNARDMDLVSDVLHGVCAQLQSIFEQTGREDQGHLAQQVAAAEESLARARAELEHVQQAEHELCAAAGRYQLDRDQVLAEVEDLRRQMESIEMELQSLTARRSALAKQIAEVGERAAKETEQDPVVAELEKVVSLRQAELAELIKRVDEGLATQSETRRVQEEVARARAELAQYRRTAVQQAGGAWLDDLNKALVSVSSELLSENAKRTVIEARLEDVEKRNLLELVNRYDREVRLEREMAELAVRRALSELHELTQQKRSYQSPRVTVLGGR